MGPEPETFSVAEYYQQLPAGILATAKEWNAKWEVLPYVWNIPESQVEAALKIAPIVAAVTQFQGGRESHHIMAMVDKDDFLDS